MRLLSRFAVLATACLSSAAVETSAASVSAPMVAATLACLPAAPCAAPLPVKVVIVSMFEIGKDTGDAPGEFQLWKERRKLDVRFPVPQAFHDLFYNPDSQILGVVTGVGSIRSAIATMALGLDQRFDLKNAYWLIAGIAGIDPEDASIGSAAWARYIVDGDLAHEIDAREIPKDWKNGFFPMDSKGPNDPAPLDPKGGELLVLNPALADWAFALTRGVKLPDDPGIKAVRARYTGYPKAQLPPFVLEGEQLSSLTFWHGKLMNDWANGWVRKWTGGKGDFVTSAMEESGTVQALGFLDRLGRVDKDRVMVLRSGSNYTMPPPDMTAAESIAHENEGYSGMTASLESLYVVGSKVVDELLGHWGRYETTLPK